MRVGKELYLLLCAAVSFVSSQSEESICLTSNVYGLTLACEAPQKILVHNEIKYGVNSVDCLDSCCANEYISCTEDMIISVEILNSCNGLMVCALTSVIDVPREEVQCEQTPMSASFANITYSCVDETTTSSVTVKTTIPSTYTKPSTSTETTIPKVTQSTGGDIAGFTAGSDTSDDMPLVIGLSVAGGVIIIVIVVVIAVYTTRHKRRDNYGTPSSTKTLATSDVESTSSPGSAQSSEDVFGFAKSAKNQQERLQKRNDNIKRNQSFKSEESQNKRPSKLSKYKSKSKSSSLDQLDSNPKTAKESQKGKQSSDSKKQAASKTVTKDEKKNIKNGENKKQTPPDGQTASGEKSKTESATHPIDAKSKTNLLDI